MIKISIAVITYNEEDNITRCLQSVKGLADEIIVVDSFSEDKTTQKAEELGARVIKRPFPGHIEQKNFAIDQTKFDWVLSLDADEALSSELKNSLEKIKMGDPPSETYGFFFNRLTNYAGLWIKHCGWYPDKKLRLFHKKHARWAGLNPHDIIEMKPQSKTAFLSGNLLHYSYTSISDHVNQTNNLRR